MAIQIDRMETSVEVTASEAPAQPRDERTRVEDPGKVSALRESMMQILSEELSSYRRMRGH